MPRSSTWPRGLRIPACGAGPLQSPKGNNDVTGIGLAYKIVCRGVDGHGPVRDPDRASLDTSDERKPQQQATALFMGSVRPTKMSRARRGRDRLPRRAYRADFLRETCGLGVDGARACPWRLSCLMAGLAGCGLCFGGGFGKTIELARGHRCGTARSRLAELDEDRRRHQQAPWFLL